MSSSGRFFALSLLPASLFTLAMIPASLAIGLFASGGNYGEGWVSESTTTESVNSTSTEEPAPASTPGASLGPSSIGGASTSGAVTGAAAGTIKTILKAGPLTEARPAAPPPVVASLVGA